jgi:hypothetical protein
MISAYAKATGTQDSNSSINSNASMVEVKEDSHIPGWKMNYGIICRKFLVMLLFLLLIM